MTERIKTIGYVLVLLGLWSWVQERDWQDRQSEQQSYVRSLERTLATCLSATDQPIWVDGELHYCSMTRTGIRL